MKHRPCKQCGDVIGFVENPEGRWVAYSIDVNEPTQRDYLPEAFVIDVNTGVYGQAGKMPLDAQLRIRHQDICKAGKIPKPQKPEELSAQFDDNAVTCPKCNKTMYWVAKRNGDRMPIDLMGPLVDKNKPVKGAFVYNMKNNCCFPLDAADPKTDYSMLRYSHWSTCNNEDVGEQLEYEAIIPNTNDDDIPF